MIFSQQIQAINPPGKSLKRNIPVFFHRVGVTFILQQCQSTDDSQTGIGRFDDIINIPPLGSNIGIGDAYPDIPFSFSARKATGILCFCRLPAVKYSNSTLGAHNRNFSRRPGIVNITAQMLR